MKILLLIYSALFLSQPGISQEITAPQYISIAYIKSTASDFESFEENWVAVHNQLIKDGKKMAWYLYKVKYPSGRNKEYDYVRLNILKDWASVENPNGGLNETIKKVHPDMDINEFYLKTEQGRIIVYEQLFSITDQAVIKEKNPAQFILVNEMKTVDGMENEYVNLERTYFKPFHQERIAQKMMNNWLLLKTTFPYGDRYDVDYITLNGFDKWDDITKNPPPSLWQKVHGEKDFNKIHNEILTKRKTINVELWELVAKAVGK